MTKHAVFPRHHAAVPAKPPSGLPTSLPRTNDRRRRWLAPLTLLMTWRERSRFRAALRVDLLERPEHLRDIGICEFEARAEMVRFFWEPILLTRR